MASRPGKSGSQPAAETLITQQPRRSERNQRKEKSHTDREVRAQGSPTPSEEDYDIVEEEDIEHAKMVTSSVEELQKREIKTLHADLDRMREQLHQKEAEIACLHQQNMKSLTSDEFHSAQSTPYSSMSTERTCSSPVASTPTVEQSNLPREADDARISKLEETVNQKHKRIVELERRLDQATKLEPEMERLIIELSKYQQGASKSEVSVGEVSCQSASKEPPHVIKLRKEVNELRPLKTRLQEAEKRKKQFEKECNQERRKNAEVLLEVESLKRKIACLEGTSGSSEGVGRGNEQSATAKQKENHFRKTVTENRKTELGNSQGEDEGCNETKKEKGMQRDDRLKDGVHDVEAELQVEEQKRKIDLQEKEKMIQCLEEKVWELEKAVAALGRVQQHSKAQSQHLMGLQDQAKAKDIEAHEMERSLENMQAYLEEVEESRSVLAREKGQIKEELEQLKKQKLGLEGQLQVLEADMSKMILKEEQQERTLLSFTEQVRSLTEENTSFRDQLKKFGHLHDEIPELNTNIAVLQQTLQKVERERDDFKSTLETTQAQVSVYEEDFKAEREDRVRAHAQRNEEGERYREEVARLQKQLNSHKGNLSGLENVHLARQKELMQAMEDLRKSQEEVQAKTSQVKQYKKQHDGLVAKVASLEAEIEGLTGQFEAVRQELEKAKASPKTVFKPSDNKKEVSSVHEQLTKQTEKTAKYKMKSQTRKAQILKLTTDYGSVKLELERAKREVEKFKTKERKKLTNEVSISSPVSDKKGASPEELLQIRCRVLEDKNEELQDQVKVLTDLKKYLHGVLGQPADGDDESTAVESPTHQDVDIGFSSPDEDTVDVTVASISTTHRKMATGVQSEVVRSTSRPRSSSASEKPLNRPKLTKPQSFTQTMPVSGEHAERHTEHQPTQPHPRPGQVREHVSEANRASDYDKQHADCVNQSQIQAMLDARQKGLPVSPHSTPVPAEESEVPVFPPPVVMYPVDEQKMVQPQKEIQRSTPGDIHGHGYIKGSQNVQQRNVQGRHPRDTVEDEKPQIHGGGGFGGGGYSAGKECVPTRGEYKSMGQAAGFGSSNEGQLHIVGAGNYRGVQMGRGQVGGDGMVLPRGVNPQWNMGRAGGAVEGGRGRGMHGEVDDEWAVKQHGGGGGRYPEGGNSQIGDDRRLHDKSNQSNSGPTSLPTESSSLVPSLQRQHSVDNKLSTQSDAQHERDINMQQQVLRLGNDILSPGINTELHNVAQDLIQHGEGEGREVTGVPFDPNLTCVVCGKVFRIGEIQLYRNHTATCGGTIV